MRKKSSAKLEQDSVVHTLSAFTEFGVDDLLVRDLKFLQRLSVYAPTVVQRCNAHLTLHQPL